MQLVSEVFFTANTDFTYNNYVRGGFDVISSERKAHFWTSVDGTVVKRTNDLIEEIRDFCKQISRELKVGRYNDKKTYDILFTRGVKVKDIDDKEYFQSHEFNGGSLNLILSTTDKLIYPADIRSTLDVSYYFRGITPEISELNKDTPVFIEKYDEYNASVRSLSAKDTVVDTHLNQIWPVATHKPPVALIKLLKQTKEKIR